MQSISRIIFLILVITLLASFTTSCEDAYANVGEPVIKTFDEMTQDEKQRVLDNLKEEGIVPSSIRVGDGNYPLNEALWFQKGIIAYGSTAAVNAAVQTTGSPNYKDGMYRYWGYDLKGGLYGNDDFPRDSDTGTPPYNKQWLTTFEISNNDTAKNYVGRFAMTTGFSHQEKWTTASEFLKQNPSWVAAGINEQYIIDHFYFNAVVSENGLTQGQFIGVHRSRFDGRLYYQTFSLSVGVIEYLVPPEEAIPEPEPEPEPQPEPDISLGVDCNLSLPAYTYEGHPVMAEDSSIFTVEGDTYSAWRAYEENLGSNRFSIVESGPNRLTRISSIRAEATFRNAGYYHVELRVTPKDGSPVYDTKGIEVRKTPSIEHTLTGVQKQNRKQLLSLQVATHPDYPLTEFWLEIVDPDTDERVRLYHNLGDGENTLENSEMIKTRPIEALNSDRFFENCRLEFLTKNSTARDYRYIVYVKDERGQTDRVEVDFSVAADHPPMPEILMEEYFIRGMGSDLAEITVEDNTVTDGDQLERTWYFRENEEAWIPLTSLEGYEDLSFGTAKKVKFLKYGVGSFDVRLDAKDVWTEETLHEYISEEDYLSGTGEGSGEVINVAPVIKLEPIKYQNADITILTAGQNEYEFVNSNLGLLKETMLSNAVDADIVIEKMIPPPSNEGGKAVDMLMEVGTPFGYNGGGTFYENENYLVDDERLYKIDASWTGASSSHYPESPYTISCWEKTGELRWTYTFSDSLMTVPDRGTYLAQDDRGKYLFLVTDSKTMVLTKDTGSFLTILNTQLSRNNFVEGNTIYSLKGDGIYSISSQNGNIRKVYNGRISGTARRLENKVHFLSIDGMKIYRAIFDPSKELVYLEPIGGNEKDDGRSSYSLTGIDVAGKFIVSVTVPVGNSFTKITRVYNRDNELIFSTSSTGSSSTTYTVTPIYNEGGQCNYIAYSWKSRSGSNYRVYAKLMGIYDGYVGQRDVSDTNGYPSQASNIVFAREIDGRVYLSTGAYWTYILYTNSYGNGPVHGYPERTKVFVFNPSAGSSSMGNVDDLGMKTVTVEYGKSSDTLAAVQIGDNHIGLSYGNKTSLLSWEQDSYDILRRYINKNYSGEKDINALVIFDQTNSFDGDTLNYFNDLIESKNGKLFITNRADIEEGRLGDEILSLGDEGRNVLGITVDDDGGSISKTFKLQPGTTYYYEYSIKGMDEIDDALRLDFNITSVLEEESVNNEGYVVTESYFEDFNDSELNPFFNLIESRVQDALYRGGHAYKSQGSNWKNYYVTDGSSLTFTVPEGKKAVLSFDWDIMMDGTQKWMANFVRINGTEWREFAPSSGSGHYTHPELLHEGENSLDFYARAYGGRITEARMWIDNLRVDIVEEFSGDIPNRVDHLDGRIMQDASGYLHVSGSFKTPPNVVAYRSQRDVEIYSGPIGSVPYTGWDSTTEGKKKARLSLPSGKTALYTLLSTYSRPRYTDGRHYGVTYSWGDYRWGSYAGNNYPESAMTNCPTNYRIRLPKLTGTQIFSQSSSAFRSAYGDFSNIKVVIADKSNVLTDNNRFFIEGSNLYLENDVYNKQTEVFLTLPKGDYLLKDFNIYTISNGVKVYITDNTLDWDSEHAQTAIIKDLVPEEEAESLVYSKGELVEYSIHYYDYEADPSKRQYWRYTHTPFNDGPHPDAATILDEEANPVDIRGGVLDEPINIFYIDGKYTVEHWQEDNTSRPLIDFGNPEYDKPSNIESITFYIVGGASAPWIEYIGTKPSVVKEGDSYSITVLVDDLEKDLLRLTTEVYKDGSIIFTDRKTGIAADQLGNYPPIKIDNLPAANSGIYEIVCTVRDETGVGIDSYRFTVTSIGNITGNVYHTQQWDTNRKKYNLHYFGEEFNKHIPLDQYLAMKAPRKRGTNVFWSGERFMLSAEVAGTPEAVTASIPGSSYVTTLHNSKGETVYSGELWDNSMLNRWGRREPEQVIVRFTAKYAGGADKTFDVPIILDSTMDYWLLHRLW